MTAISYKNGQPKVSANSFQYALRYTVNGIQCFQTYKTVEELTVALGRVPTKRFIDVGHLRLPVSKEEFRTGSIPSGAT
jgi:hypothetical protein